MKTWLIQSQQASWNFGLFYLAAFLLSFVILIFEGRKRKIPTLPWLITIGSGFVFFVIGCHFAPFSADDWRAVLNNQQPSHATGMTMLGGILVSVPIIFLAKRLFRLHPSVLDAYAVILPLGMCIQRIGCFLAGCCYGKPTTTLGIQYGPGSAPFQHHQAEGWISAEAACSLPVLPVQLFEAAGCLLSVMVLLFIRNKPRLLGRLFYVSGLSYYVVRFVTECFRDIHGHAEAVFVWSHLNSIQWVMIVLVAASILILYLKKPDAPAQSRPHKEFAFRHVSYFLILCLIFLCCSKWLSPIEILAVNLVLFTTAGYLVLALFKSLTVPGMRIASLSLVLLSLVLMSQTYPLPIGVDSARVSYNTVSVGILGGIQNLSSGSVPSTSCSGAPTQVPEKVSNNTYTAGALGFSRTIQNSNGKSSTFGISALIGKHDEQRTNDFRSFNIFAVTPYIQHDSRIVGLGVGAQIGDFTTISELSEVSAVKEHHFYPQLYFRVGELQKVYAEFSFAKNFPSAFPSSFLQANLGFGINKGSRFNGQIRIGTSTAAGFCVSSVIPIRNVFIIEPTFGIGNSFIMKGISNYDEGEGAFAGVNLHLRFDKKVLPK